VVADEFNEIFQKSILSYQNAKAIADYVRGKGITIRQFLENNGFKTANLPKNTYFVTAKAWDDSGSSATRLLGYNYQKAYYKGVNIDAKGAGETNVQLLDCGINDWKLEQWNYSIAGNACAPVLL